MSLHSENRARLLERMRKDARDCEAKNGHKHVLERSIVLLAGGEGVNRHDTDHEPLFRQESNFHWAFGVREPDFCGIIDMDTGRSTLFCPRLPPEYAIWMGAIKTCDQWRAEYAVDDVRYLDELPAFVRDRAPSVIHRLRGYNTDGKRESVPAKFDGIDAFTTDDDLLAPALAECRVFKSAKELELLRFICTVSSEAHIAVMQHTRPGLREYQLESLFRHWCYYYGGARYLSYTCICASGHNASVLHYGHAGEPNGKTVRAGDLCLFDMGAEFHCYGSDITVTYPASGTFTVDQRLVYEAVFAAQTAVMDAMKPGVAWPDMHFLAQRTLLQRLRDGGMLRGDVDDMMRVNLGSTFMPHGLGHMLGIDTHDSGGYTLPHAHALEGGHDAFAATNRAQRDARAPALRSNRLLEAGMYVTVEPGCYFIDHLLDAALADPEKAAFLVPDVLARFRGTGGVRIEDDVLVTADGCENFTHAPKSVDDIEAVLAGRLTQRMELKKFH